MATRLIIDGNAVYELDEECLECRRKREGMSADRKKSGRGAKIPASAFTAKNNGNSSGTVY